MASAEVQGVQQPKNGDVKLTAPAALLALKIIALVEREATSGGLTISDVANGLRRGIDSVNALMSDSAKALGIPTTMVNGIVTCNCEECIAERGN